MAEEDILSPPYPGEGTTTILLHGMLEELRDWIEGCRAELAGVAGGELIPALAPPMNRAAFARQPVVAQYRSLLFLWRLREGWDDVLRRFEDEWDSAPCVRRRVLLASLAAQHLNASNLSFELREARRHDDLEGLRAMFDQVTAGLCSPWEPSHAATEDAASP